MAKSSIVIALALALGGCATASLQLQPGRALPAPTERLTWEAPQGADAKVLVARDTGFAGGGCFMALFINGKLAARLGPGEAAEFRVPSGEVLLGVGHDPDGRGLCAGLREKTIVNAETSVKPGEQKSFRMMVGPGGQLDIRRAEV